MIHIGTFDMDEIADFVLLFVFRIAFTAAFFCQYLIPSVPLALRRTPTQLTSHNNNQAGVRQDTQNTILLRMLQGRPSPDEAPPMGKIHPFSKTAVTFEPMMGF